MDPRTSAQDVMLCDLCKTAVVQMHCDICLVNLCKPCVGEHMISDQSKKHDIVPFMLRKSTPLYPGCTTHSKDRCEMYCKQCDIPVCDICIASDQHLGHKFLTILQILDEKKSKIIKQHTELKEAIYPTYQDIASDVQNRMRKLKREYGYLLIAITKHGEDWHKEIDKLVKKLTANIDEMKNTHLQILQKHLDEINKKVCDIKDLIDSVNVTIDSKDLSKLSSAKFNVEKYKKLPQKIVLSIPKFMPKKIQEKEFHDIFGTLTRSSLTSDEHGYSMKTTQKSPEAGSSPEIRQLLDKPETVNTIDTEYTCTLIRVACLSGGEIWTSGKDSTMQLYSINPGSLFTLRRIFNLHGSLLKSITTETGNIPIDMAVTKKGYLLYADYSVGTVNIVKNERIEEVMRLKYWKPLSVCSISPSELLVLMYHDESHKTKVVRYSESGKQTIQFDDKGKPLYLSREYFRFMSVNRNLDICVSDTWAVVVVSQAGKLRFKYTGHTPAPKNKPFYSRGITTDSQSHILTADRNNHCVHIIDQDGQFLRYIDCGLIDPYGLCTDANDNLFVAQGFNRKVNKIKYLQ